MQITVPPGARVVIETQDAAPLTLSNPPERRRIGSGPVIAIIAFAAGAFAVGIAERAPARANPQAASQPGPADSSAPATSPATYAASRSAEALIAAAIWPARPR